MVKKRGGLKTAAQTLGRKGGRATLKSAGREHFAKIGREAMEQRWNEIRRAREVLELYPPPARASLAGMISNAKRAFEHEGIQLAPGDKARVVGTKYAHQFDRDADEIIEIVRQAFE